MRPQVNRGAFDLIDITIISQLISPSNLRQLFLITRLLKCLNMQIKHYLIKLAQMCIHFQNRNLNIE